ncbi:hypothetical protein KIPB_014209, partial [Kipferlia bialata]
DREREREAVPERETCRDAGRGKRRGVPRFSGEADVVAPETLYGFMGGVCNLVDGEDDLDKRGSRGLDDQPERRQSDTKYAGPPVPLDLDNRQMVQSTSRWLMDRYLPHDGGDYQTDLDRQEREAHAER